MPLTSHLLPRRVVVKPDGNLASRLRCIASFAVVADALGVVLEVYWPTHDGSRFDPGTLFSKTPSTKGSQPVFRWVDVHAWDTARDRDDARRLEEDLPYLGGVYRYSAYKVRTLFTVPFATPPPGSAPAAPPTFCYTARCTRELSERYQFVLDLHVPGFAEVYRRHLRDFVPQVCPVLKEVEDLRRAHGMHTCGSILGIYDACNRGAPKETTTPLFLERLQDHLDHQSHAVAVVVTDDPERYAAFANDDRVMIREGEADDAPAGTLGARTTETFQAQWVNLHLLQYAHMFYGGIRCPSATYVADIPFCANMERVAALLPSEAGVDAAAIPFRIDATVSATSPCTDPPSDGPVTVHTACRPARHRTLTTVGPHASSGTRHRLPVFPYAPKHPLPGFWYPPA